MWKEEEKREEIMIRAKSRRKISSQYIIFYVLSKEYRFKKWSSRDASRKHCNFAPPRIRNCIVDKCDRAALLRNFCAARPSEERHIEATLVPAVGSHDNMTSTGRVLFSKGDSSDATPAGEIANYEKQLDNDVAHHGIWPRNNNAYDIACRVMIIERNSVGNI